MMRDATCQSTRFDVPVFSQEQPGAGQGGSRHARRTLLACLIAALLAIVTPSSSRAADQLKLDYVPRDAVLGFVIHPERTMKLPELEILPWELFTSAADRSVGINPAQVNLAVFFIGLEGWTINEPSMGAVLYFSQPIPVSEVFNHLGLNNNGVKFEGVDYYRYRSGQKQSITVAFPDERTLVIASNETYLKKMLSAKPQETGFHRLLRRVDMSRDLSVAIDFEKLAPLIVLGLQAYPDLPPVFDEFLQLPALVTSIEASVKVRTDLDLQLTLGARDANDVKELKKLAEQAKARAREYVETQIVPNLDSGAPGEMHTAMANYARRITKALLDKIEVKENDKELSLHAKLPLDVVSTGLGVIMLGATSTPAAQPVAVARPAAAAPPAEAPPAVLEIRPAVVRFAGGGAKNTTTNLKQIGLAMHTYHDVNNKFPPPAKLDKEGKQLLSWRVALLPFIEGGAELHKKFHLDEPWDSEHNKKLIEKMPDVFRSPGQKGAKGTTVYLAADGKGSVFEGPKPVGIAAIADGTSNTIMVVEADDDHAVIWTKPDDLKYDAETPLEGLGKMTPKAFVALFCDGAVVKVPLDLSVEDLRALFTRNGKEVIQWKR